jgi:hypothetical protein
VGSNEFLPKFVASWGKSLTASGFWRFQKDPALPETTVPLLTGHGCLKLWRDWSCGTHWQSRGYLFSFVVFGWFGYERIWSYPCSWHLYIVLSCFVLHAFGILKTRVVWIRIQKRSRAVEKKNRNIYIMWWGISGQKAWQRGIPVDGWKLTCIMYLYK